MCSPEYTELSRCQILPSFETSEIVRNLRANFPINEFTEQQWNLLEAIGDERRALPISHTTTYRFCERVEFCPENGVHLMVTRYIEIDPFRRRITPKKTVRVLPTMYPVEMYLKNWSPVLKL